MGAGQGTLGLEADPVSSAELSPSPEPAQEPPGDADVETLVRRALDGRAGRSPLATTCPFLRAGEGEASE